MSPNERTRSLSTPSVQISSNHKSPRDASTRAITPTTAETIATQNITVFSELRRTLTDSSTDADVVLNTRDDNVTSALSQETAKVYRVAQSRGSRIGFCS